MRDHSALGPWVRRFLLEYMVAERNLASNTQVSYRDTLTLLLPFVSREAAVPIERLAVHDVSPDRVRAFLDHIEHERRCGVVTRNQRLSAIHSLARFIGMRSPEHLAWCSQVRSVPFKKAAKTVIGYLDKPEVEALLRAPDRHQRWGRAITLCCCSSTTAAPVPPRRRLCGCATFNWEHHRRCASSAKATSGVYVLYGQSRWRHCERSSPERERRRPGVSRTNR
jgi:integrase